MVTTPGSSCSSLQPSRLYRAGIVAWVGAYLKIKGENLATKQNFDDLLKQQEETAKAVEDIKSEISQRDWARREWANLRRIKLEALLEKMHGCQTYLDQYDAYSRDHTLKAAAPEHDPMGELQTIAELYRPELRDEVFALYQASHNQVWAGMNLRSEWFKMALDVEEEADKKAFHAKALGEYGKAMAPTKFLEAVHDLRAAARTLLVNIMDVPSDER